MKSILSIFGQKMNCRLSIVLVLASMASTVMADESDKGHRESIEWCNNWFPSLDKNDLPHVLLIGDSIVMGYCPVVEKQLAGKAYVARICTSQFISDPMLLSQLKLFLGQMKFDVIHFNNGLHGASYSEAQYRAAFPAFLAAIQESAPQAKLIWASTTTFIRDGKPELNEQVKARNAIAHKCIEQAGISEDDLFSLISPHPELHDAGGIHYKPEGYALLGRQVASEIENFLPKK